MRARPAKKKMKKLPEVTERARRLREALGMTQTQFAEHTGISRPRISEWEAGKTEPSAEASVLLGNVAGYPACLWFWKHAGLNSDMLLSTAETIVKDRTKLPLHEKIALHVGALPTNIEAFCVAEGMTGAFSPGDMVLYEPMNELKFLWDRLGLAKVEDRIVVGWFSCKAPHNPLAYVAAIGPSESGAWLGPSFEPVSIGGWQHEEAPKAWARGNIAPTASEAVEIERLTQESVEVDSKYNLIAAEYSTSPIKAYQFQHKAWSEIMAFFSRSNYQLPDERFKKDYEQINRLTALGLDLNLKLTQAKDAPFNRVQAEAKARAPNEIMLNEGVSLLGRMVAWFPRPREQQS